MEESEISDLFRKFRLGDLNDFTLEGALKQKLKFLKQETDKKVKYGDLEVIICNTAVDVCAMINDSEAKVEAIVLEPIGSPVLQASLKHRLLVFYRSVVVPSPKKKNP